MANRSYNNTGIPAFGAAGSSTVVRNEFAAITSGFAVIEAEIDAQASALEWVDQAYTSTYSAGTVFIIHGADATNVMQPHRRLRLTVNGAFQYSEVVTSVYTGGDTTVTILDSVLTNQFTLAEYSIITPYEQTGSALSTPHIQAIVDTAVSAAILSLTGSLIPVEVDTSAGNVAKTLPTSAVHASYIKTTADANIVSFATSDGSTIAETVTLDVQYSRATFDKVGTVWYRS